jgi:ring-1,2-phenylacetyl-CoA epoxidase subunit PaaA
VPQAKFLGLTVPDPQLRWNEDEQRHEFGAIDWNEFERVLKGNGPCNASAWRRGARACRGRLGARGGDRVRREATPRAASARREVLHGAARMDDKREWPLFEVFIRARGGLDHKHVGSLHAADARMAIEHARDLYTRREEGVSIWVVPSTTSRPRIPRRPIRCSSRRATRSIAIRRSTTFPMR